MADFVAVWGAVTGTVAVVFTARRELLLSRARLGITHGVHFFHDAGAEPTVMDAWLVIRVWNRGGQPLTVEHVGLRYMPSWQEGHELHIEMAMGLAEIDLQGVAIELSPGGPSRRLYAPLRGLVQAGLDVLDDPMWAWAKTSDDKEWEDQPHPVVPGRVGTIYRQPFEQMQTTFGIGTSPPPMYVSLPNEGPLREGGLEA